MKRLVIAAGLLVAAATLRGAVIVVCRAIDASVRLHDNPMFDGRAAAATVNALCLEYAEELSMRDAASWS